MLDEKYRTAQSRGRRAFCCWRLDVKAESVVHGAKGVNRKINKFQVTDLWFSDVRNAMQDINWPAEGAGHKINENYA